MSTTLFTTSSAAVSHSATALPSLADELKKIHSARFCLFNSSFSKSLKDLSVEKVDDELKKFFTEILNEDNPKKILDTIERLADHIGLDKLDRDPELLLVKAQAKLGEARLYLQTTSGTSHPGLSSHLNKALDGTLTVVENTLAAFGIADFFRHSSTPLQADFKSQKILMLLNLFMMLTTLLIPAIGPTMAMSIIGGILLGIAILSIIFPMIKPTSSHLPGSTENWHFKKEEVIPQVRNSTLDKMADILQRGKHVVLTGPSRVGKSWTAKLFAKAVERGDYPALKDMKISPYNTAILVDQAASFLGGPNQSLKTISDAMGDKRGKHILVLDEIQSACTAKGAIADEFKTYLDEGGEFPHVIGITTEKEFTDHVKSNVAFRNRFVQVKIDDTTESETLAVLSTRVMQNPSRPLLKSDTLSQIYKESSNAPQPSTAIDLLDKCITLVDENQPSKNQLRHNTISQQISSLQLRVAASCGENDPNNKQIEALESSLKDLESALKSEMESRNKLLQLKKLFDRAKDKKCRTIQKVSTLAPNTKKCKRNLALYLLLKDHLSPVLEKMLEELFIGKDVVETAKSSA